MKTLKKEKAKVTIKGMEQQFLTFNLAGQLFAIDIGNVKEIIAYGGISYIPLAPKFVKGVLNLRGNAVPVLDLSFRFKKIQADITKVTCIVIVEAEKNGKKIDIGLVVDSVNEVISLNKENIDPSPDFGTDVHIDFIDGIGKVKGEFIVIINAQAILDVKDFSALEKTIQSGGQSFAAEGREPVTGEAGDYLKNLFSDLDTEHGTILAKAKAAAIAAAEAAAKAAAVADAAQDIETGSAEKIAKAKEEAEKALKEAHEAAQEAIEKVEEVQSKSKVEAEIEGTN
ncbi:MAG: chemotaxis protein CheW [Spirochaetia bacterium]|nr:chemotaxis protein CheW [Spirochaetia bacterium]